MRHHTSWLALSCWLLMMHDLWRTASSQHWQTDSSAPPARWHLWASATLPTSQHTTDCKCYQCCQVESIFVSHIGSQCSTNSIMAKTNGGQSCWPEIWQILVGYWAVNWSEILGLWSPSLILHQTTRPHLFPYGTSPPCVWYAGV